MRPFLERGVMTQVGDWRISLTTGHFISFPEAPAHVAELLHEIGIQVAGCSAARLPMSVT